MKILFILTRLQGLAEVIWICFHFYQIFDLEDSAFCKDRFFLVSKYIFTGIQLKSSPGCKTVSGQIPVWCLTYQNTFTHGLHIAKVTGKWVNRLKVQLLIWSVVNRMTVIQMNPLKSVNSWITKHSKITSLYRPHIIISK